MTRKRRVALLLVPILVLVLVLALSAVGVAGAGGSGNGNGNANGSVNSVGNNGNGNGNGKKAGDETTATTAAVDKGNNGKGVIHTIYTAPDGTVYNAIYHVNTGVLTVTGAIYPQSGPLKFYPDCGPLK
ncbi:MAG: hypothetical protein LLG45_09400 [Actinomycetia bacterium]|nr:hypothetical protein [Actinomycetes bacterium]